MEQIKAIDVKIYPYRRLKPKTSEKILNSIMEFDGILRVLVNGESIPKIIGYGPAKGMEIDHEDRKIIKIKDKDLELFVTVGEIIVTIRYEKLEFFKEKIETILKKNLSCEYDILAGIFTKTNITVSDYLKLGWGLEDDIDPSLIGMVDPKSKSSETVKLIGD